MTTETAIREAQGQWRCFHCDEVFTTVVGAAFHFGYADLEKPACLVDAVELRNLQLELRRYREEDTDLHRALHAKDSEMQQAVMRAEEQGYARGLADAKKNPGELGLAALADLDTLRQRAEKAEEDALRYRWLRDKTSFPQGEPFIAMRVYDGYHFAVDDCDAAVDAARAAIGGTP